MIALLFLENFLKAATKNIARKYPVDSMEENNTMERDGSISPLTARCKR